MRACYKCESCLLLVVPPSDFKGTEIQKLIHEMMKKKRTHAISMPSELIASKSLVWMPYHSIQFEYKRSEKDLIQKFGETAQSETTINAMFCGCAQSESELFMLFRPNYLKYKIITYSPRLDEIIGPTFHMDFDAVLSGFLKRLNEAKDELKELRSTLSKRYARISRYSKMLPMKGDLKEAKKLSEQIAKLSTLTNILNMGLNLSEDAGSIKAMHNSTFYYPTLVVALKQGEHETERLLIINLIKSGSIHKSLNCDDGLTQLCNKNDACKEVLIRTVAQASLHT